MSATKTESRPSSGTGDLISVQPLTGVRRSLVYRVPSNMQKEVCAGSLVRVPLLNRSQLGIVESMEPQEDVPASKIKYLHRVEQPFPVLSPDLLELAAWMEHYYAAGRDQIFEVMIPSAVRKGMRLQNRLFLRRSESLSAEAVEEIRKRAPKQATVADFFLQQLLPKPIQKSVLAKRMNVSSQTLDGLVEKGLLIEEVGNIERNAYDDELGDIEQVTHADIVLNEEQRTAFEDIEATLSKRSFCTHLLHGVTGSGKTEVYLAALTKVLDEGGSVIFLVPEVALTPQTVGRLRARLEARSGHRAVVWHSHLSDGERYDSWHAIATGKARVVVGARSAIFAPVRDLRLIIVDEEHEPAYKQEEIPRYHGRDTAVYRAHLNNALCLLGSATPSLETIRNVETGKYRVNHLRKRIDDRQLPTVHVVDMKRERPSAGGVALFSRFLADKMQDRLEKGEQTILFLNRRGYDASVNCPDCGFVAVCDHCDITMTHHRSDNILRCHLCGAEEYVPTRCPKCRSPQIKYKGSGTQKVEFYAQKILPKARIVRIDADTMRKKNLFRSVLGDFRRGKIDVLVGTQMIAKGLDFPNVTLVGLIDADISLHLPDFRASERTFQLLVQVAGRAGRGDMAGEVVVQTCIPYDPAVQFARAQDFDGFAEQELENRREYDYPPYRHVMHHLIRGKNQEKVRFYAEQWVKFLTDQGELPPGFEVRGPAPCPIERIKDAYRFQVWYFSSRVTRDVGWLCEHRRAFKWDPEVIEVLDVDPVNLI